MRTWRRAELMTLARNSATFSCWREVARTVTMPLSGLTMTEAISRKVMRCSTTSETCEDSLGEVVAVPVVEDWRAPAVLVLVAEVVVPRPRDCTTVSLLPSGNCLSVSRSRSFTFFSSVSQKRFRARLSTLSREEFWLVLAPPPAVGASHLALHADRAAHVPRHVHVIDLVRAQVRRVGHHRDGLPVGLPAHVDLARDAREDCLSVWSIALRLIVPSIPGWMSKFTRVSRAIASSTSRTGGWRPLRVAHLGSRARVAAAWARPHGLRDSRRGGVGGRMCPRAGRPAASRTPQGPSPGPARGRARRLAIASKKYS